MAPAPWLAHFLMKSLGISLKEKNPSAQTHTTPPNVRCCYLSVKSPARRPRLSCTTTALTSRAFISAIAAPTVSSSLSGVMGVGFFLDLCLSNTSFTVTSLKSTRSSSKGWVPPIGWPRSSRGVVVVVALRLRKGVSRAAITTDGNCAPTEQQRPGKRQVVREMHR